MSAPTSPRPSQTFSKAGKRRANSCKPCRDSKSKCSGGIPCTTCQKKRQKPRCYYLNSFSRDGEGDETLHTTSAEASNRETLGAGVRQETVLLSEENIIGQNHILVGPHEDFYGILSLARSVDEFKLLLPAEGQFQDIIDSIQPVQVFDLESERADAALTTRLAALEQTRSDPEFDLSPPLQLLYARYHSVRDLLIAGMATQAWAAFASLVREAELFGLKEHANPVTTWDDMHDPQPGRHLWWLIAELDTQLSFLLGRRPCINPSHSIPKPMLQEVQHEGKDNERNILDFTEYMADFLDHINTDTYDARTFTEERRAMLQSDLNRLQQLQSKLPPLPQNGLSDASVCAIAQHQVDVQLVLMVLYCQLLRSSSPDHTKSGRLRNLRKSTTKSYYRELLKSLRTTIDVFDYSYGLDPTRTTLSWPRCFGIFCAASMLGMARLRQEVDVDTDSKRVKRALEIFTALVKNAQAPGIAQLAADSLADILQGINELDQQPTGSTRFFAVPPVQSEGRTVSDEMPQPPASRTSRSTLRDKTNAAALKRRNTSNPDGDGRAGKRARYDAEPGAYESSLQTSAWQGGQDHPYPPSVPVFDGVTTGPPQEPTASHNFEQHSFPLSISNPFNTNDQMEFYEAGYVPTHPDNFDDYHAASHWVHPPMIYAPPLYDDWWQTQFSSNENIIPDANQQQVFYHPPLALPMDQVHSLENAMHSGQHPGFVHMQQPSPTHADNMMIINTQDVRPTGSTSVMTHTPSGPQQGQLYSSRTRVYAPPDSTMGSPEEAPSQMEAVFNRPAPSERRRSMADIRQPQMGTWTIETPANYNEQISSGNERGDEQERPRSPPRAVISSPGSSQNSPSHGDRATMHLLQSQQSGSHPLSRSQSQTQMEGPVMQISGQSAGTVGGQATDHTEQQQWQDQPQARPSPYDLGAHTPYDVTMTSDGVMDYSQQLQYPHVPMTHVVTTGPFTGDGQGHHWEWTR